MQPPEDLDWSRIVAALNAEALHGYIVMMLLAEPTIDGNAICRASTADIAAKMGGVSRSSAFRSMAAVRTAGLADDHAQGARRLNLPRLTFETAGPQMLPSVIFDTPAQRPRMKETLPGALKAVERPFPATSVPVSNLSAPVSQVTPTARPDLTRHVKSDTGGVPKMSAPVSDLSAPRVKSDTGRGDSAHKARSEFLSGPEIQQPQQVRSATANTDERRRPKSAQTECQQPAGQPGDTPGRPTGHGAAPEGSDMPTEDGFESVGEAQKRERGQADRILLKEFTRDEAARCRLSAHIIIRAFETTEHKAQHGGFTRGRRAYFRALLKSPAFRQECMDDRRKDAENRAARTTAEAAKQAERIDQGRKVIEAKAEADDSREHAIALMDSMSDERVAEVLEEVASADPVIGKRIRRLLTVCGETARQVAARSVVRTMFVERAELIASGERRYAPVEAA